MYNLYKLDKLYILPRSRLRADSHGLNLGKELGPTAPEAP
jgi:hypothetical protein